MVIIYRNYSVTDIIVNSFNVIIHICELLLIYHIIHEECSFETVSDVPKIIYIEFRLNCYILMSTILIIIQHFHLVKLTPSKAK